MNELYAVILITLLAVISPGPDFAMITRNSYAFGRRAGLMSALGIAFGVQVHVLYTAFGIAALITGSPALFIVVKIAGAAYLVYLGVTTFITTSSSATGDPVPKAISQWSAFKMGFFTNALNPKTMLFVIATYTQVLHPFSPLQSYIYYGLFISVIHWLWFSFVAVFFSTSRLREKLLQHRRVLDGVIGSALVALGASLLIPEAVLLM
jgi:RhtB (resistance to homoserine/threonine) family protein